MYKYKLCLFLVYIIRVKKNNNKKHMTLNRQQFYHISLISLNVKLQNSACGLLKEEVFFSKVNVRQEAEAAILNKSRSL